MLIDFLQFMAQLILALTILRVVQVKLIDRDENSLVGSALAFIN